MPYAPIKDEIRFLEFVCGEIKSAYPDFRPAPAALDKFSVSVAPGQEGAPVLTADLSQVFETYQQAEKASDRQNIIEGFLSSIGNTVFNMDAPLSLERFIVQLRHRAEVCLERGEICLPFLGDMVAGIMRPAKTGLQAVTQANLDVLGLKTKLAWALALKNSGGLAGQVLRNFKADWPGLVFTGAAAYSPSALIYRDFVRQCALPDGAYFICDRAHYVYTSPRDEATMANLLAYQRHLRKQADAPVSESLLIRQKGTWHVASLTRTA